jgi:serine/threonine protein phosphatase 1
MNRYVVGDLHGNKDKFVEVLVKAKFNYDEDLLIVLGDIVDGHDQVYELIEELLKIKNKIMILGNHDRWFIDWLSTKDNPPWIWHSQGGRATLGSYMKNLNKSEQDLIIPVTHQELFNSMVNYCILDNMIFVHGGFNPMIPIQNQLQHDLIWDRELIKTAIKKDIYRNDSDRIDKKILWKKVFVGHTSTMMYSSPEPIIRHNLVMMDTGAGWRGKVTLMNIDTDEIFQSSYTLLKELEETYNG